MGNTLTQEERTEIFNKELKRRIKYSIIMDYIPYHKIHLSDEQIDMAAEKIMEMELDEFVVRDALELIGVFEKKL